MAVGSPDEARTVVRRTLGEVEHQVLLAILRKGSESYSVEIVLEIERCTGREIATSAVFIALKRLAKKGFLEDRIVEPADGGGHTRRYFSLTPLARETLRDSRRAYLQLWDGYESVLDDR
jgi:DNA-binding PadR family transcriptional regulator